MRVVVGVYVLWCTKTGKAYVGSSRNCERRRKAHFEDLRGGRHTNPYLQAAWKRHGGESFTFEVIEECLVGELFEREQFWMGELKTCDGKYGYNLSVSSKSSPDAALLWNDPEFRKTQPVKISETMIALCKDEDIRLQRKKISNEYWSGAEARNKVGKRMRTAWQSASPEEKQSRLNGLKPREITRFIELHGIRKPLIEWSELSGLPRGLLAERLKRGENGLHIFRPGRTAKPTEEFISKWLTWRIITRGRKQSA